MLIKGGHLSGEPVDTLYCDGVFRDYPSPRLPARNTHGTGCTYSAAITALLARGARIADAVSSAKKFITSAIAGAPDLGKGTGPVNHFADAAL